MTKMYSTIHGSLTELISIWTEMSIGKIPVIFSFRVTYRSNCSKKTQHI
jgi:hypothetical protein